MKGGGNCRLVAAGSSLLKQILKDDAAMGSGSTIVQRLSRSARWSSHSHQGHESRAVIERQLSSLSEVHGGSRLLPVIASGGGLDGKKAAISLHDGKRLISLHASMKAPEEEEIVLRGGRQAEQPCMGFAGMQFGPNLAPGCPSFAPGGPSLAPGGASLAPGGPSFGLFGSLSGASRGIVPPRYHGFGFGATASGLFSLSAMVTSQRGFFGRSATAPPPPSSVAVPPPLEAMPEAAIVEPPPAPEGGGVSAVSGYLEAWKLPEKLPESLTSTMDGLTQTVQDAVHKLPPSVQEALNPSNPYFQTIVQESAIGLAFLGAWTLLPRYLRSIHRQIGEHATLFGDKVSKTKAVPQPIPYHHSMFNAIEDPARFIISLVAFTHAAVIVAPNSDLGVFLNQAWGGGLVLSFVWFLYRWKSNYFARVLSGPVDPMEREKLRSLDRVSSIGLYLLATLSVAETSGFAVQSILTVGGIGGVATAFAARDVIGNVLSGAMLYFNQPFTIGDTIMAGNVKGKVVDVGLASTQLLNSDKHPVTVPNSFFSSQVIVNESRAKHRGFSTTIPLVLEDLGKVPQVTRQLRGMLVNHPKVFTAEERPRCFLSKVTGTHLEIAITCNVPDMSKDEFILAEEEILFDIARVISELNVKIGENAPSVPPTRSQQVDFARSQEHPELKSPTF